MPPMARFPCLGELRHNVPSPVASFIGREGAIDELATLLGSHRLVTLVGPPGVGKTRLGLEVATRTAKIRAPTLLLSGELDTTVPPQAVRDLYDDLQTRKHALR